MFQSFSAAVADARRHGDLYFAALLPQDRIAKAFGSAIGLWHGWTYNPAVTVWVFLSQCLSSDYSCCNAVARLIAWRVSQELSPCSSKTGAYCTARNGLPEDALRSLVRDTGRQFEDESPETWFWHGRKVRVVDGSTVTMRWKHIQPGETPYLAAVRFRVCHPLPASKSFASISGSQNFSNRRIPGCCPRSLCPSCPFVFACVIAGGFHCHAVTASESFAFICGHSRFPEYRARSLRHSSFIFPSFLRHSTIPPRNHLN